MDLIKKIDMWHQINEHQKIIDAIEALPNEEQTPELISLLARAYNNLGVMGDKGELMLSDMRDYSNLEKAIELLESVKEESENDHNWNYRMGYAYYYMNQEGPALRYFERALELLPGDEDTADFIDDCRLRLARPLNSEDSFCDRTAKAWTLFLEGEAEIRKMIDDKENYDGEKLTERVGEMLKPAFYEISFEIGCNGDKYELILTPEGDRAKLFQLVYFQKHAPAEISEHWNILVGRRPSSGFGLRMFEQDISAEDVTVWTDKHDDYVELSFYSEKLLPVINDEGHAEWVMAVLLDNTIGEMTAMQFVGGLEVLSIPREDSGISMTELPTYFKNEFDILKGGPLNAEQMCEQYIAYEMKPNEDVSAKERMDIYVGVTCCAPIINEYMNGESYIMDAFHRDGAFPGFLYYPLDAFNDAENRSEAVLNFRDSLENAVLESVGEAAVTFIGGASGIYCGYLDFIAWDLWAVLKAAKDFFKQSPVRWAAYHPFRFNVDGLTLMDNSEQQ